MSKISIIAKLTVADGKSDEFESAITGLFEAADEEPGLEVYSCHAAKDEPGVYYFFEVYTDGDAHKSHGRGEAMKPAMAAVGAVLAGRPEIITLSPVGAKGLDV